MNKAKEIRPAPEAMQSQIAVVYEAVDGEAGKVLMSDNELVSVRGHLSDVPWLQEGDEVVILDTPQGAVVSGRLRRIGEKPQATLSVFPERISLESDRVVRIQVGESQLELLPNGQLHIKGKDIIQTAADSLHLLGPVVEIN